MDKAQIKELKAKLAIAKTKPLNFAFAPAKAVADSACELHATTKAEKLRKTVKADAGVSDNKAVVWGVAKLEDKFLVITCEDEPKRPSVKALRQFLKAAKLSFKVRILDSSGKVLDDELEDEDQDTADQGAVADAPADEADDTPISDDLSESQKKFETLSRMTKTVAEQNPDRAQALLSALQTIGGLVEAGDQDKARAGMARLAAALKKQGSTDQPKTDAKAVSATFKKLVQLRSDTNANFDKLMTTLAQQPDPRINRIANDDYKSVFGGATGLLDSIETDLFAAAGVWNQTQGAERKAAEAEIRHCIQRLRSHLDGNALIALLEDNPFVSSLKIKAPLLAVLNELDGQLAA